MTVSPNQLNTDILYPESDETPMAESDPARDYLIYGVEALDIYFKDRDDVYVSGNLFIYYKKGVPSAVVAPDVFVVFGVEKRKRKVYKIWEEGNQVPSFVMEITSARTQENDEEEKPRKYSQLGVQEYFQYDPTGDYLQPKLKGSRLITGQYQAIPPMFLANGVLSIYSEVLDLDLQLIEGELRFYDRKTDTRLLTYKETESARQQESQARREAIPRLLGLGLTVEQIAEALGLSLEEVRQFIQQ